MPRRRASDRAPLDDDGVLAYLDLLVARLDRLADRIEAYAVEDPLNVEGHHDTPPPA